MNMRVSMSAYKQVQQPLVNLQRAQQPLVNLQRALNMEPFFRRKDKVVFVVGPTGTGKSRLAIDLATRFPAEVVNCDKIQVHKGLDIVTNKVTEEECRGVPHHLLGIADPDANFTKDDFRHHASFALESIGKRDRLPIIAGGSNSFVEALVSDDPEFQLRYDCCFLWVDVSLPVLHSFVSGRVDRMVKMGLLDEVRNMFDPTNHDYTKGIRRAIGVPELDPYFRNEAIVGPKARARLLDAAIARIKENTCTLACRQLQKIHRLHGGLNRNMHRIDATDVFLKSEGEADEAWEKIVTRPSTMIVDDFLYDEDHHMGGLVAPETVTIIASRAPTAVPLAVPAMAAASR